MIAAYCVVSKTPSVADSNIFEVAYADAETQRTGVFKISLPKGRIVTDRAVEVVMQFRNHHTTLFDTALLGRLMEASRIKLDLRRPHWPHSDLLARLEKLLAQSFESRVALTDHECSR
jgi:hypothetical protein